MGFFLAVVRLSYGPKMDVLKRGLDGIERVVKKYVVSMPIKPSTYSTNNIDYVDTWLRRKLLMTMTTECVFKQAYIDIRSWLRRDKQD